MNTYYENYFFFIILGILIVLGITTTQYVNKNRQYNLKRDGCSVIKNAIDSDEISKLHALCVQGNYKKVKEDIINNTHVQNKIHKFLSNDYIFQDYIWIIQKSAVHTCHRDNNGDFLMKGKNIHRIQ